MEFYLYKILYNILYKNIEFFIGVNYKVVYFLYIVKYTVKYTFSYIFNKDLRSEIIELIDAIIHVKTIHLNYKNDRIIVKTTKKKVYIFDIMNVRTYFTLKYKNIYLPIKANKKGEIKKLLKEFRTHYINESITRVKNNIANSIEDKTTMFATMRDIVHKITSYIDLYMPTIEDSINTYTYYYNQVKYYVDDDYKHKMNKEFTKYSYFRDVYNIDIINDINILEYMDIENIKDRKYREKLERIRDNFDYIKVNPFKGTIIVYSKDKEYIVFYIAAARNKKYNDNYKECLVNANYRESIEVLELAKDKENIIYKVIKNSFIVARKKYN